MTDAGQGLLNRYDGFLLDLDGVCFVGDSVVPGAVEAVAAMHERKAAVRYITNNASRTRKQVADLLTGMGFQATDEQVVTSATVAARRLAKAWPPGSPVLVVGGEGIVGALESVGLRPVDSAAESPVAILQGWAAGVGWAQLAEAAVAIAAGAQWMATNLDRTLPSARGQLPGNGSLVAALTHATGRRPETVGKPEPDMYDDAVSSMSATVSLAVGDRLDTDIDGANRAGIDSLLVLSGVSTPMELALAEPPLRPTLVARDLGAVSEDVPSADWDGTKATCRDASAYWTTELVLSGDAGPDGLDHLRAALTAIWHSKAGPESVIAAISRLDLN